MGLKPVSQLRKGIATWVAIPLMALLGSYQLLAQVAFEVSSENNVLTTFTDSTLIKALESAEVNPKDVLKIYVGADEKDEIGNRSAILGAYRTIPGRITFKPLVPFSENIPYLAVFGDTAVYPFQFTTPLDRLPTLLLEIYPTTDTVPANLLKVYLQFSRPMREGQVYERVKIYDQNDDLIKNPFVPLQPELWDSSGHMVTLWLDPGRVKRGLGSRETHGPVLEEGSNYRLVIDSLWKDASGRFLETTFTKSFHVIKADRNKPETKQWQLTLPEALTNDPLMISFEETMDFATTRHAFSVWTPKGEPILGLIAVVENERIWKYIPDKHWLSGVYKLRIDAKLEDLAGNNLNRAFDRDLASESITPLEQEFYWIEFKVLDKN